MQVALCRVMLNTNKRIEAVKAIQARLQTMYNADPSLTADSPIALALRQTHRMLDMAPEFGQRPYIR